MDQHKGAVRRCQCPPQGHWGHLAKHSVGLPSATPVPYYHTGPSSLHSPRPLVSTATGSRPLERVPKAGYRGIRVRAQSRVTVELTDA